MQFEVPLAPSHPKRQRLAIGLAVALTVPALVLRLSGTHPVSWIAAGIFGIGVVGAVFLLAWGAEVLQLDVSAGLALAVLALVAVLPEYAVDFVFTAKLQREELFLTAAQSAFAVAVLANRSINTKEAYVLLGLFLAQFALGAVLPEELRELERIAVGVLYLVLAAITIARQRGAFGPLLRDGFRTPVAELALGDDPVPASTRA